MFASSIDTNDRSTIAKIVLLLLGASYLLVAVTSIHVGAAEISIELAVRNWLGFEITGPNPGLRDRVIFADIRLPRLLMGTLVGAALAVSGAAPLPCRSPAR